MIYAARYLGVNEFGDLSFALAFTSIVEIFKEANLILITITAAVFYLAILYLFKVFDNKDLDLIREILK